MATMQISIATDCTARSQDENTLFGLYFPPCLIPPLYLKVSSCNRKLSVDSCDSWVVYATSDLHSL